MFLDLWPADGGGVRDEQEDELDAIVCDQAPQQEPMFLVVAVPLDPAQDKQRQRAAEYTEGYQSEYADNKPSLTRLGHTITLIRYRSRSRPSGDQALCELCDGGRGQA